MQAALIEEFQIAAMSAAMQMMMMMMMLLQALNVVRRNYLPEGAERESNYQARLPSEATMRAHSLVGEMNDVLSRRSATGGGEAREETKSPTSTTAYGVLSNESGP